MRFIVDAQLPPALARWLTAQGHVADRQMADAPDAVIWDFALQHSAIIVTKDEDFAQRKSLTGTGPAIIWVRLHNARRQALLSWFEKMMPHILEALERGETLIEVA